MCHTVCVSCCDCGCGCLGNAVLQLDDSKDHAGPEKEHAERTKVKNIQVAVPAPRGDTDCSALIDCRALTEPAAAAAGATLSFLVMLMLAAAASVSVLAGFACL
jgi:hypothetical protein